MSIKSEIDRIKSNVAATYTALSAKGATMPTTKNSANLAATVASIANADTVDGLHVGIRNNGTAPPTGTTNTITFVYNG